MSAPSNGQTIDELIATKRARPPRISPRRADDRQAAGDPRHRLGAATGLPHDARGPQRPGLCRRWGRSPSDGDRRGQPGPRASLGSSPSSTPSTPAHLRRHRPRQGASLLGVPPERGVRDAAGLSRLGLRQRLQPARPHLPCDRAGRRAVPPHHRRTSPICRPARTMAAMVPIGCGRDASATTPGPIASPATTSPRRSRSTATPRRATPRASRSRRWRRSPTSALPRGYNYEWTGIAYQQKFAGNTAGLVFGLAVLLVFLVLAAQYESLVMPLAIILIVPMCAARGDDRASICVAWTTTSSPRSA